MYASMVMGMEIASVDEATKISVHEN